MSNEQQIDNLVELLDGYSEKGGQSFERQRFRP